MASGHDWTNFIFINIGFLALIALLYYLLISSQIAQNWQQYRCNPAYMLLFSKNVNDDFVYCVQNIQTSYMGYLLQPLTQTTSQLTDVGIGISNDIQNVRGVVNNVRTFTTSIFENIFGVFLNLVIEFQRISIKIKDIMGKLIGVMTTLLYVLDGGQKTMASAWNGPNGQLVRSLGHCFHPKTQLRLQSGEHKSVSDIRPLDVLEHGDIVIATMTIDNTQHPEQIYQLTPNVFVSGSHPIFYRHKWIHVHQHPDTIPIDISHSPLLHCFITDSHLIHIDSHTLSDWEDWRHCSHI